MTTKSEHLSGSTFMTTPSDTNRTVWPIMAKFLVPGDLLVYWNDTFSTLVYLTFLGLHKDAGGTYAKVWGTQGIFRMNVSGRQHIISLDDVIRDGKSVGQELAEISFPERANKKVAL